MLGRLSYRKQNGKHSIVQSNKFGKWWAIIGSIKPNISPNKKVFQSYCYTAERPLRKLDMQGV